jgi:hypothetical protein
MSTRIKDISNQAVQEIGRQFPGLSQDECTQLIEAILPIVDTVLGNAFSLADQYAKQANTLQATMGERNFAIVEHGLDVIIRKQLEESNPTTEEEFNSVVGEVLTQAINNPQLGDMVSSNLKELNTLLITGFRVGFDAMLALEISTEERYQHLTATVPPKDLEQIASTLSKYS